MRHKLFISMLRRFSRERNAGIALFFSLALVPLVAVTGAGYDLVAISALKTQLQIAADAGALRAARELRLARSGAYDLTPVARPAAQHVLKRIETTLRDVNIAATLVENNSAVNVTVSGTYDPKLIRIVYKGSIALSASAVARSNGFPVCALGLDSSGKGAVYLEADARVTAQYCAVHSNSKHPHGLSGDNNSLLTAGMICSSGGKYGKKTNFSPEPLTDCPVVPDPLAERPAPAVGTCAHTDEVIDGGTVTLHPGVYCGGLKITGAANITLAPGEYVIKDGKLSVDGGSSFKGANVGIFLTGAKATFSFATNSSISLTAPIGGALAGMLFYEDRNATLLQQHEILSNDASLLLGTIYLPRGRLRVDANKAIAQNSAFTIIVAQRMELYGGPDLVLNSDYEKTSVPVPGGLNARYSYLVK